MGVVGFKLRKPWQRRLPVGYGGLGGFAGLDLNFASNVYALNGPYSSQFPTGWSFSRTDTNGTATALTLAGAVVPFGTGVPRITDRGLLVEESRTNKLAIFNANPDVAITNVNNDTTGAVVSRVSDVAALSTAGLSAVATDGNVVRGDNTANGSPGRVAFITVTGNTNPHGWSAYVRGTGSSGFQQGSTANPTIIASTAMPASYERRSAVYTPGAANASVRLTEATGADTRILLQQLEEGAFVTSPIIISGVAGTRGLDAAAITVPSGVSTYTATYNGGLTATGAVTPGASFNLVTGRPWFNGYLQRLVMQ